jgi:hypothetical protein
MKRTFTMTLTLLFVAGMFSQAYALDGYRDRKGMFYGLTLGGASSSADVAGSKNRLGYVLGAKVGGGVNDKLTLDASFTSRSEGYTEGGLEVSTNTLTMYLGGNYFLQDGLYVRAMAGLASTSSETDFGDASETGLGFGLGTGYEFFASAQLAVGIGATFEMQQYSDVKVTVVGFGVGATWY